MAWTPSNSGILATRYDPIPLYLPLPPLASTPSHLARPYQQTNLASFLLALPDTLPSVEAYTNLPDDAHELRAIALILEEMRDGL